MEESSTSQQETSGAASQASGGSSAVIAIVAIVLIVGGLMWYMRSKAPAAPTISGPVKIGVIAPLTGEAATYGDPDRKTIDLALEEINAAGGINGNKMEAVYEDGECKGEGGATAIQKLINVDKVSIVLGGACSSESLAATPIAEQNKVLLFSAMASSPDLTGKSQYFVRNYPSDATQGQVLADVASKNGWKLVAFIQEQQDYPLGIYKAFTARFEELGGKTAKEEFRPGATDFRSTLQKLKGQKPDALFVDVQTAPSGDRVLKQLKEMGWKVPLLLSDALIGDAPTVKAHAATLEGALGAEYGIDLNNPKFQHLLEAYKNKYNEEVPYQSYMQAVYDSVYMVRDAVAAVGNDGTKVAKWLRDVEGWQGASGTVDIAENGDRVGGHLPKIVKDGKTELLNQ